MYLETHWFPVMPSVSPRLISTTGKKITMPMLLTTLPHSMPLTMRRLPTPLRLQPTPLCLRLIPLRQHHTPLLLLPMSLALPLMYLVLDPMPLILLLTAPTTTPTTVAVLRSNHLFTINISRENKYIQ